MNNYSFRVENGAESTEWPIPVKEAFLRLVQTAQECDFNVMGCVGLNMKSARAGETRLSAMLSPNASSNPYRADLCADIAEMFKRMAERSKQ